MKQTIIFALLCAFLFCGCEPNQPKHPNNWSPQGRMYVHEYTWFEGDSFREQSSYSVFYFLSTKQVVRYSTKNKDYSVDESYDTADTLILKMEYPNFYIQRDVTSERWYGEFLNIKTIKYGSDIYDYINK